MLLLMCLALLAGCGAGTLHSAVSTQHSTTTASRSTVPPRSTTSTTVPVPKTDLQLGLDVYWNNGDGQQSMAQIHQSAVEMAKYAKRLHANALSYAIPMYMSSQTANGVYTDAATPTPDQVATAITVAQHYHLRVTLRPVVDENYRLAIEPTDRTAWFMSYEAAICPYLQVAATKHVPTFIIGAELGTFSGDPNWQAVIAEARSLYQGQLAYSTNWDSFSTGDLNVTGLDRLGVDAYWPIKEAGPDASVSQLVAGWNSWFTQSASHGIDLANTVVDEIGIAAIPDQYGKPYNWGDPAAPLDFQTQVDWFTAACQAVQQNHLAGIYFWRVDFGTDPAKADPNSSDQGTYANRPGAQAIASCFQQLS